MPASLSAIIVPMPSAEPVVGHHRAHHDAAAAWGVPAHVTVLYPFVAPAAIDEQVLARAGHAVSTVSPFDVAFAGPRWFGESVLWLAPEPDTSFRALTAALGDAFPEHPPYGGAFSEVVPHLTVGHDVDLDELRRAKADVVGALPVHGRVEAAEVWTGDQAPGTWARLARLPLGG